jgi:hypothetical protein
MRRRENALYLVFKIAQRLEHSWRPLNGRLTIMTLLLGGAGSLTASTYPTQRRCQPPNQSARPRSGWPHPRPADRHISGERSAWIHNLPIGSPH